MDGCWAVASVGWGQEFVFRDAVIGMQAGMGAYTPVRRYMKRPRHSARPWVEKRAPAIERYVLIWAEDVRELLRPLVVLHNISYRVLRANSGEVLTVRQREVDRLRNMETGGALDNLPGDIRLKFARGSIHFVRDGVFAGGLARVWRTPRLGANNVEFEVNSRRVIMPLAFFGEI